MIKTLLTLIGAAILAFGLVTQSPPPVLGPGGSAAAPARGGS